VFPFVLLVPGIEYAESDALHVVRVDPARVRLFVKAASLHGGRNRTAGEWLKAGEEVAINAGMFATDYVTHTGYMRIDDHTNSEDWLPAYQSILLLDEGRATIADREDPRLESLLASHRSYVQNLRLIRKPGRNVWQRSDRRWSEAALAMDGKGRILFLFSRRAHSMRDFNRRLLSLDLGIVAAMHLEGGPEASLSIRTPSLSVDLAGSYETGFNESDDNERQWPIPNVLVADHRPN
jgi:hypothetical protein